MTSLADRLSWYLFLLGCILSLVTIIGLDQKWEWNIFPFIAAVLCFVIALRLGLAKVFQENQAKENVS